MTRHAERFQERRELKPNELARASNVAGDLVG